MKLIGYIRVSRRAGRQGESFIAPTAQRRRIKAQASAQGHQVIRWIEDIDQSGGREDRPGFQEALEAVESGEADGIAVAYLSRFARSVAVAARALDRLEREGGVLLAADVGLDTSTSSGRLMRNVILALGEFELEQIRERAQGNREDTIARGVHICRVPPVGYLRPGKGKPLELDPVAAPVVREFFHRKADGATWDALCAFMDESLPRENGKRWTRSTLAGIIGSRTYLGEAYAGDIVKRGAHPALLDRARWEAAQTNGKRPQRRAGAALLQGLARCVACGHTLTRMSDGARGYMNYECRKRHSGGICPEPTRISVRRLDGYVEEAFLAWLEREYIALEATERSDETTRLGAVVEAAESELREYRDGQLVSVIGRDAFVEGLEQRQRRVDEARAELQQARRSTVALPIGPHKLVDLWPSLTADERHGFLVAAIDAVAVRRADLPGKGSSVPRRVHIFWRGQAPVDLPGRGSPALRRLEWRPDEVGLALAHQA
jgi:DNA invertase Pin-like site-specific DNA recombinase